MKQTSKFIAITLGLMLAMTSASFAASGCYADYKAKQSAGALKLHYGVAELPQNACKDRGRAQKVLGRRLSKQGWTLLTIVSTFDATGLTQRQGNAGAYFLKY